MAIRVWYRADGGTWLSHDLGAVTNPALIDVLTTINASDTDFDIQVDGISDTVVNATGTSPEFHYSVGNTAQPRYSLNDPNNEDPTITFDRYGRYTAEATAYDGELSDSDFVNVDVRFNLKPIVREINPPFDPEVDEQIAVTAVLEDDGHPNPPATLTVLWSSTDGDVTITNPTSNPCTFESSVAGLKPLTCTADDSQKTGDLTVFINVLPGS